MDPRKSFTSRLLKLNHVMLELLVDLILGSWIWAKFVMGKALKEVCRLEELCGGEVMSCMEQTHCLEVRSEL